MSNKPPAYLVPLLAVLAVLSVLVPFLVWHETWFGRTLSGPELERYLRADDRPRRVQHALAQVSERITRGESAGNWYPRIAQLARHSVAEVRMTAAWVMGQDNRSSLFHSSLLPLLDDPHPMVRRNAALSLVRFADASGRKQLVEMLHSYIASAPAGGEVRMQLAAGRNVGAGSLLARIRTPDGGEVEVRSPFPGEVVEVLAGGGSTIRVGEPLARIRPSKDQLWEALRALYLIGQPEDLAEVEHVARDPAGLPPALHRQAKVTAQAIRRRSERSPTP